MGPAHTGQCSPCAFLLASLSPSFLSSSVTVSSRSPPHLDLPQGQIGGRESESCAGESPSSQAASPFQLKLDQRGRGSGRAGLVVVSASRGHGLAGSSPHKQANQQQQASGTMQAATSNNPRSLSSVCEPGRRSISTRPNQHYTKRFQTHVARVLYIHYYCRQGCHRRRWAAALGVFGWLLAFHLPLPTGS